MSKDVDQSDLSALNYDDLKYLHDRAQITTAQMAEALGMKERDLVKKLVEKEPVDMDRVANTGNANTRNLTPEQFQEEVDRRRAANAGESGQPEAEEEEVEYSSMSNDDLRVELARRNLSVQGNKAELIARLEEDDASDEEG